ncbi:dihydropyrimidinase [Effusibacillus consociatus]|uniref:Dihydropyrimidinase n=1 Tax=Effusibacillus consociatus TaxID=1117041 RepID=A0ABV9PYA8_9BACL
MRTIIRNGTVATSADVFKADIQIINGVVTAISERIVPVEGDHVIEATDQYVFPGGIDVHTHLAFPGTVDDFESGTKAAASGGITSIINFTDPKKGQSVLDNLREWQEKAKPSFIDYGFHSIINECNERVLEEVPDLAEQGVTSIKLFMAYKDHLMVNDVEMYKLMKTAGEAGIITNVHAENGDVIDQLISDALSKGNTTPYFHASTRPCLLEAEATGRALAIAEAANAPVYIVHVSCAEALQQVEQAKKRGVQAYAETCPQYLVLDSSYLAKPFEESAKYVCSPPLRDKSNQTVLWNGLASGLISTVASDHSSIPFEGGKALGRDNFAKIPNGCPGIEDIFSLIYHFGVHEGRISLQKFVEITSSAPAKLFGLYPKKGTIAIGSDADLVVLDPRLSRVISKNTQSQSTDYNLYEGTKVQGVITYVLSRGEELVQEGRFLGKPGRGEFLHRKRFKKI